MEFDEYKTPDDIYARFKVADAMNELAACSCKVFLELFTKRRDCYSSLGRERLLIHCQTPRPPQMVERPKPLAFTLR